MISNLDSRSQLFLTDIERVQQRISDAQRQVSSGHKVNVASDAPDVVSDLLRLRAALARNTQIQTNLGLAQTAANVADSALSSSILLLDRALTLGAQGATDTQTAAGRKGIAQDIEALEQQLVGFSQTQSGGWYLFSGDQETAPAYQLNLANGNGVDRLLTTSATRLAENPAGGTFLVSKTAEEIFDHRNLDDTFAPDNAFAALNNLRVALENNDTAGVTAAITSVRLASDRLNACQSFYGTVQNRIQDALAFTQKYDTQIQTEISQKQDADIAAAALEFSQGTANLQAAFQMQGRMPRSTLFDFITG